MSSVVIAGDTSGTVTLQAPAVAGSTVLSLPSTTGTVLTTTSGTATSATTATTATNLAGGGANTVVYQSASGTTAYLTNGTTGQLLTANTSGAPTWSAAPTSGFTLGTPVATTSGTSIDFTGIPSGVKQIVINFRQVSTNSTSYYLIQLGDSGGIETTGYSSRSVQFASGGTAQFDASTNGYISNVNRNATAVLASGSITLTLENATSNTWVATGMLIDTSSSECAMNTGNKSLSAVLDRVRITTVDGTSTFDNGEINIAYI
jgi:hypothetical protein